MQKQLYILIALAITVVATLGFVSWKKKQLHCGECGEGVNKIKIDRLKERMADEPDLTVINVLSEEAYNDCNIKGSINIPYRELAERVQTWNRNKKIVVYCASKTCTASRKAYEILHDLQFKNIWEFTGGMKKWKQKGYPSEGPCKKGYLQ